MAAARPSALRPARVTCGFTDYTPLGVERVHRFVPQARPLGLLGGPRLSFLSSPCLPRDRLRAASQPHFVVRLGQFLRVLDKFLLRYGWIVAAPQPDHFFRKLDRSLCPVVSPSPETEMEIVMAGLQGIRHANVGDRPVPPPR